MPDDKALKNIEKEFNISLEETRKIINDFHSEMENGLSGHKSSLKMIPTYVKKPEGTERGKFLALDLGGTNFRVLALELKGRRRKSITIAKKFVLEKKHITGTGRELFEFLANCIKIFMSEHNIRPTEKHNIGFTFSFPMRKRDIASGILLQWTKGFRAKAVVGKDVVKLFNQSLESKGLRESKVVALANDTVSTLVAKSYEDPHCDVGVIIGTGTNACYCEKDQIVNIEWGNFNKLRLTSYDKELDEFSENPGEQLLEKRVSGMYLGEVARLVVKDLIAKKILFEKETSSIFNRPYNFKTEYMSVIEGDNSNNLSNINALLKKLHISNSKYGERLLLKRISTIISTRAARASAAGIAAVVTRMDPGLSRKHTIAIDGTLYEKHPGFSRNIKLALKEIFKRKANNIKLSLTKDASGKGAAIIAATQL